jgi:hypothetical protein
MGSMTDKEIEELIAEYGFMLTREIVMLCEEVERRTRNRYFSLMQNANNIANEREMTARELYNFAWNLSQGKLRQERKATEASE